MYGINDPSALLRPWKDLKQFSEELYAMFTANRPGEPVQSRGQAARPGVSVEAAGERRVSGPSESPTVSSVRESRVAEARSRVVVPEQRPSNSHASERAYAPPSHPESERVGFQPTSAPEIPEYAFAESMDVPQYTPPAIPELFSCEPFAIGPAWGPDIPDTGPLELGSYGMVDAAGIIIDSMSSSLDPGRGLSVLGSDWQTKYPDAITGPTDLVGFSMLDFGSVPSVPAAAGGDSSVFIGKIVSGSGDSYRVELYPDGPKAEPGDTVDASVPMIDPDDEIPSGTWVSPVFFFPGDGDLVKDSYSFQPPVWLS